MKFFFYALTRACTVYVVYHYISTKALAETEKSWHISREVGGLLSGTWQKVVLDIYIILFVYWLS